MLVVDCVLPGLLLSTYFIVSDYEAHKARALAERFTFADPVGALRAGARRLFEFGGHVGVAYYAYRSHLTLPEGFSWTVCDVPAVAATSTGLPMSASLSSRSTKVLKRPE